jgi:hypothetical protein
LLSRDPKFIDGVRAVLIRNVGGPVLMGSVGLLLCGCAEERPVWSTEVRSSDGEWRAVAQTYSFVGPGANSVETIVKIESGGGLSWRSSHVLGVADFGQNLGLTMKWMPPKYYTPTRVSESGISSPHLVIVINDDPDLVYYQVVKTSGVEISLKNEYSRTKQMRHWPR